MIYTINIKRFLFYFLAPAKRYLPTGELMLRLKWWQYLFAPLMGVFSQYDTLRKKQRLQANTTSELAIFEHYLRKVCNDEAIVVHYPEENGMYAGNALATFPRGVYVDRFADGELSKGVFVGLRNSHLWNITYSTADMQRIRKEMSIYLLSGVQCDLNCN